MLQVNDECIVLDVQQSRLQVKAVDAIAVDFIIHEIAGRIVHRQLPEFRHRWKIVHVEGDRVGMFAIEGLTVAIGKRERCPMRDVSIRAPPHPKSAMMARSSQLVAKPPLF